MTTEKKKIKTKQTKKNTSKRTKTSKKRKEKSINENKYTNTFTVNFDKDRFNQLIPFVVGVEKPNILIKNTTKKLTYEEAKDKDYIHILCMNDPHNIVNKLVHDINHSKLENKFKLTIDIYNITGDILSETWELSDCEITYVNNGYLNYFESGLSTINLEMTYNHYKHTLNSQEVKQK